MLRCPAKNCPKSAADARSLSIHEASCKHLLEGIANTLRKRALEDVEEERARKRARRQENVVMQQEALLPPASPIPPPASPSPPPAPPSPLPIPRTRSGRPARTIRVPKHLVDFLPTTKDDLPVHLADAFPDPPPEPPSRYVSPTVEDAEDPEDAPLPNLFHTPPNVFGLFREYTVEAQRDPEADISLSSVCDAPTLDKGPNHADDPNLQYASLFWLTRDGNDRHDKPSSSLEPSLESVIGPFANKSQFRLYDWFYNASLTKSMADFDDILDVLLSDGFSTSDLAGFSSSSAQKQLDDYEHPKGIFSAADGWREGFVEIPLPKTREKHTSEGTAPKFKVDGIHYRSITEIIRGAAADERFAKQYHWSPHTLFWTPPPPSRSQCSSESLHNSSSSSSSHSSSSPPIRVINDVYNANRMLREFAKIQAQPRNPADDASVEYAIASIMLWSDETHLTSFGSAALWPIYLYLGNLSKYIRGMPTQFAAHHLAYIPSLPDQIRDAYKSEYKTSPSKDVLTFCKRELIQRIWLLLLDEEFMKAYEHGILVTCGDGVVRRIFPRILSYSADYPEKMLLTAIKPLSNHPCPRCLIHHDDLCDAGTPEDAIRRAEVRTDTPKVRRDIARARDLVFKKGVALSSKKLKKKLDSQSLNPIQSAFSTRFAKFGMNFYELFVPDLMHEFELGVWKGTFIHLMRLLSAQGEDTVQEFNQRMRNMPTFGWDKIRKFFDDVSARKQLAARDYEDFLICMIPAFEGLLPLGDNENVLDLLFELANWHALAKLKLHTKVTLDIFRAATEHMTEAMRSFAATTCENYETHELDKEVDARVRREEKKPDGPPPNRQRKVVHFNTLNTPKYHFLPDYPDSIEEIGTTDTTNTQVVSAIIPKTQPSIALTRTHWQGELEHRHVKHFYARTNKIRYALQIAKHQRRAALMRALRQQDDYMPRRLRLQARRDARTKKSAMALAKEPRGQDTDDRAEPPLPPTDPLEHYAISDSRRLPIRLRNWLAMHDADPAVAVSPSFDWCAPRAKLINETQDFIPILREHLLSRLLDPDPNSGRNNIPQYTDQQLDGIEIENDRIYRHKMLRINYTTYDMRRDQDVVNPRTHSDIMMFSPDSDAHPFLYARVIDIFDANVRYTGPGATRSTRRFHRMNFLWVRWLSLDEDKGFQGRRLPRLRFLDSTDSSSNPFGFVDPDEILRAAFIVPAFDFGTTRDLLGPSELARRASDKGEDYNYYYACFFADRDMYMRYLGGGVGHRENGIDVESSKQHALRWTHPRQPEPADGASSED
ncbi:hypothetical protein TRAPUB_2244, partial [Trametes pubescens]